MLKNPVTRLCTLAGSFRMVNMFSCDYFLPGFMLMNYPLYRKQFGLLYAICVVTAGLSSSISGGVLADKYGPKSPKAYSKIGIFGSLIAWPFFITAVLLKNNFYLAMACIYTKYLFGECFRSANITMIQ